MTRRFERARPVRTAFIIACLAAGPAVLGAPIGAPAPARSPALAARPAGPTCPAGFLIDQTFANGARWRMCWEERTLEGLVLTQVYWTPQTGAPERLVLKQMNLSQTHVPYDDNSARFFDLTTQGMGGGDFEVLAPAECPGGTLLVSNARAIVCQQLEDRGYAWKFHTQQRQAQELVLTTSSQFINYNFLTRYTFLDDGSIEPAIGLTGRLSQYGTNSNFGWLVSGSNTYAISHVHNNWWRLDFDLDGAANDTIEEFEFTGNGQSSRPMTRTVFTTETARLFQPQKFRFWRVRDTSVTNADGHAISYDITSLSPHYYRGPASEPWTANDFYVTQLNPCENFAAHNPTSGGCGGDVSAFVNGQPLSDLVVWIVQPFHHVPKDEEEAFVNVHWSGFDIEPRDWTATNPIP